MSDHGTTALLTGRFLSKGNELSADACPLQCAGHGHLPHLERLSVHGLQQQHSHKLCVNEAAQMKATSIVGKLLFFDGQPERFAQDVLP